MLVPVIDASVVVDWIAPRTSADLPAQLLLRHWVATGEAMYSPDLLVSEVFNALLTGVRRQRWSPADADTAASAVSSIPLAIGNNGHDTERAWELARRYDNWPIYDMIYVALAERLGTSLVTADKRLRTRLTHLDWVLAPEDIVGG